ncbi:recombinase family protein [Chloroflexota bacterium]
MKAVLYDRVLTDDKGQTAEVRLTRLREYCQEMNWLIYREYVDEASVADMAGRKAWAELIKDAAHHKFDILLVWKMDHAFCSVIHAANTLKTLWAYNIGFRSYMEPFIDTTTPHGELVFNILDSVAVLEGQQISRRVGADANNPRKQATKSGNSIGRKRLNFPFTNICKALWDNQRNYSKTARQLQEETGIKRLSPAFVFMRVKREAEERGMTMEELLVEIIK